MISAESITVNDVDIAWGSSILYVRKIFRKTNISYPLILTRTCAYKVEEMLIFQKILRRN